MIVSQQVLKMFFPELRGGAGAEEVVEVDCRAASFHKLQINKFDHVGPESKNIFLI